MTIKSCIERGEDLVIEKSRDMGASWMSLVVMEWLWHFHPGQTFLMMSRKENLVDAPGDPDALFWKVDFIHKNLPDWLRPRLERRKLHYGNLSLDSTIDGESTTAASSVGGRRTAVFLDEFSRMEEAYAILAGTADVTNCRIFNFTPFGANNAAHDLACRTGVRKLRLHWSEHPEKGAGLYRHHPAGNRVEILDQDYVFPENYAFLRDAKFPLGSPWFDKERRRRANDREIAQMLEIDYQGSSYQFFDKSLILALQADCCRSPDWEGDVLFDPDTGRPQGQGLIRAAGGPLQLWLVPDLDGRPPRAPYVLGADIATGSGATNSVLSGANAQTGEKVLEYATPFLRSDQFALRATAIGWLFQDGNGSAARLTWESAGPGKLFANRVLECGYPNISYREAGAGYAARPTDLPGWYPSGEAKRTLLEEYRAALSLRTFVNHSQAALEECLDFIYNPRGLVEHSNEESQKDPSGARMNHGDRTIADALAWMLVKQAGLVGPKKKEVFEVKAGSLAWRRQYREERGRVLAAGE